MYSKTNSDRHLEDRVQNAPLTEPHQFTVDEKRGILLSIVEEMANVLGCTPTELKPLYYDVDAATLERLIGRRDRQEFSFRSNGIAVTVYGDGRVVFEPPER